MFNSKLVYFTAALIIIQAAVFTANAQVEQNSAVFKALRTADAKLFGEGFNNCDVALFSSLIAEDFEFYHDRSGITDNKKAFVESFENGLCNAENRARNGYRSTRELVAGTLQVFPLFRDGELYGAIQNGRHRFFEETSATRRHLASTARFTHLWRLENGVWKLARSLSFDHVAAPKTNSRRTPLTLPGK